MASFKRHQQNKDVPYDEGCGGIMWDAWGGATGINWAIDKLKTLKWNYLILDVIAALKMAKEVVYAKMVERTLESVVMAHIKHKA